MSAADITIVENKTPGKVESLIAGNWAWMCGLLLKRYPLPWPLPVPELLLLWLTQITTPAVFRSRGVAGMGADSQIDRLDKLADEAKKEVRDAANGQNGLFELLMSDASPGTAVALGGPLAYTESSPYFWR